MDGCKGAQQQHANCDVVRERWRTVSPDRRSTATLPPALHGSPLSLPALQAPLGDMVLERYLNTLQTFPVPISPCASAADTHSRSRCIPCKCPWATLAQTWSATATLC